MRRPIDARRRAAGLNPFSVADAVAGFRDMLPYWVGVAPFGVACALAATSAGLSAPQAMAMSLAVFAGTAQLTASGLLAAGAGPGSILAATALINVRHLVLAASLRPGLSAFPVWRRAVLAFFLTDEAYAQSVPRVLAGPAGASYFLGAGLSLYSCWQGSTLLGLVARGALGDPRRLGLELIFPLSFSVLLWPQLRDRPRLAAAISAGAVSLAVRIWLPGGPNLFAGVLAGCLAGLWVERRHR